MSNISKMKLGDIGKISMCKRILKSQTFNEGEIPFFKISTFGEKADCFISRELYEEYKTKYSFPKKGSILLSAAGTIGKTVKYDGEEAFFQDSNIVWVDNDETVILNDFLYYYYQLKPWRKTRGSTIERLYNANLRDMDIIFPTKISEQKNIIDVLQAIDNKIKNNNKIILKLETIAKKVYDYWFLQFEFLNEEGKPYKSSGGKMVWNKELKREIPKGWGATTLGKITICHDSKRIPISSVKRKEIKGNIPYYGATGVMDHVNKYIFDGDYVLVAEDGSIMDNKGNPILQRISGKSWVNNHAHVLEPINGYSCKLVMMILKDIEVVKIKTGSIQMKINQQNLNNINVIDIPHNVRLKINNQLNIIDTEILELQKENENLTKLKDYLLPLLMNGQVGFKEMNK